MATLYLLQTKAASRYQCACCGKSIPRGILHFRHDPHPYARMYRGQKTTHWCHACITASSPAVRDSITGRIRIPAVRVLSPTGGGEVAAQPVHIAVLNVGAVLTKQLAFDPELIHRISPAQFEAFVCDRLDAMGLEPKLVGPTNAKDGGIDIVFWPREKSAFPFLGAVQVKHHRDPRTAVGSPTVRDFNGVMSAYPFNAGIIVTITSFSADARWFAKEHSRLVKLREFRDLRRWMFDVFDDDAEWREMPERIEVCPGVVITVRDP